MTRLPIDKNTSKFVYHIDQSSYRCFADKRSIFFKPFIFSGKYTSNKRRSSPQITGNNACSEPIRKHQYSLKTYVNSTQCPKPSEFPAEDTGVELKRIAADAMPRKAVG